jgi:hypothetical protein
MRPTLAPESIPAFDVVLHTRLTLLSGQDVVHVAPRHRSSREAKATLEGTRCQLHGHPHHLCIHSSPIPTCPWPCSLRLGPCVNCRFANGAKSRRVFRSQHLLLPFQHLLVHLFPLLHLVDTNFHFMEAIPRSDS